MRESIRLFIGFALLWGSLIPLDIVAQKESGARLLSRYSSEVNAFHPAEGREIIFVSPKKRDPLLTYKAIQATKRRTSANGLNNHISNFADQTISTARDQPQYDNVGNNPHSESRTNEQRATPAPRSPKDEAGSSEKRATLMPVADQDNILIRHRWLASEALSVLPQQCASSLKNFYVRYDRPKRRGLAGKESIILDGTVPDKEFIALLIHEFGHITDLGCLESNAASKASAFKDGSEKIYMDDPSVSFYSISWENAKKQRAGSSKDDFVSGYAEWDPFEDFAETYAYFVLQNESFAERARENPVLAVKFKWMEQNAFIGFTPIADGRFAWEGKVPWDTTKLPYEWKPEIGAAINN